MKPIAIAATDVPIRTRPSSYPEPFATRLAKREKRCPGDTFGLANFGVNQTVLKPGSESSILHRHTRQDEFVYILAGTPTLVTDRGETILTPGDCAGFPANGPAHHLVNRTSLDVVDLEIGDRTAGDEGQNPNDDLKAVLGSDGRWSYPTGMASPIDGPARQTIDRERRPDRLATSVR